MVNILKLKGKIVEKGFNVERLAESTEGLQARTLSKQTKSILE